MKKTLLLLALLCLTSTPIQARQQASVPLVLQQFKAAPLQPQSLRRSIMPADVKEINALLAQYERKRGQGKQRSRGAGAQEATRSLLVALATKAYEVSLRQQPAGKQPSKEAFAKELAAAAQSHSVSAELQTQVEALVARHQANQEKNFHASKASKAAKQVVEKAAETAEAAVDVAEGAAKTAVDAADALVSWLTS
jgi:hypothetical protein